MLAYFLSWFAIGSGVTVIDDLGVIVFLGVIAVAFVMDGTGVITLRGRVVAQLPCAALVVLAVVFFPFFILWLIPYLIVAALDARRGAVLSVSAHLENIAKLEGALGILPPAEGVCPHCHKPLQLGAEFCVYCGKPLTPALRFCPVCHARTFPDAQWCPECGAALPPVAASPANTP